MPARLTVSNVAASYMLPSERTLDALATVSFMLEAGSFTCLVGPSGCGKSTLLRLLAGLQKPTQGAILLNEQPLHEPSAQVAIMFQDASLMPWRTVVENIALPLELAGVNASERQRRAQMLLPSLGLEEFARAYPGELSGGMAQRAALGRVLIQQPSLLLLDEPFGALDVMTREQVRQDMMRLWSDEQPTVLMVTHDIHEAVLLADRVLVMSARPGRIIEDIPVTLPRPRSMNDLYDSAFGRLARQIRHAIQSA
jgi:NitT/TauT family transport system ATP-binding protein